MDAIYSPIERISYEVESARVGQNGNFDFNQLVILTEALKLTDDKHITKLIYEETEDFIGNNNNNQYYLELINHLLSYKPDKNSETYVKVSNLKLNKQ